MNFKMDVFYFFRYFWDFDRDYIEHVECFGRNDIFFYSAGREQARRDACS